MFKGIIGRKLGMSQVFTSDGNVIPVTVVEAGPCVVTQKKTVSSDGYEAIQVGFDKMLTNKRVNKPMLGHFNKSGVAPMRHLHEFRLKNVEDYNVGQVIEANIFSEGDFVDVQGTSIGKGFQGVIKRFGFSGGPMSHGSHFHRHPGSIGMCNKPGEVQKGKKLPGRMGGKRRTAQRLQVVRVVADRNLLLIKGSIPGCDNGVVYIKSTVK